MSLENPHASTRLVLEQGRCPEREAGGGRQCLRLRNHGPGHRFHDETAEALWQTIQDLLRARPPAQ